MSLTRAMQTLVFLPRGIKKLIVLLLDVVLCLLATWLAFSLRFDDLVALSPSLGFAAGASVLFAIPIFIRMGMYRAIFRFSGWFATMALVKAMVVYALLYAALFLIIGFEGVPRSIGIFQPLLLFVAIGSSRLAAKSLLNSWAQKTVPGNFHGVALIYGAGSAGRQLASGLRQSLEIKPVGFVDEDSRLWKGTINGLPVYAPSEVPGLIQSGRGVTDILLAIPSASRARQKQILNTLSDLPVHVRTLPGLSHLANGEVNRPRNSRHPEALNLRSQRGCYEREAIHG